MDSLSYKTEFVTAEAGKEDREWLIVDAEGQTLGRMASEIAKRLRGKHKPSYTPHNDCGDSVIVINAEKIHLTGKKWSDKKIITHSGYPGGQKIYSALQILQRKPTQLVEDAVKGMLPHNRLGRELFRNLFVHAGSEHPHAAQQPKEVKFF